MKAKYLLQDVIAVAISNQMLVFDHLSGSSTMIPWQTLTTIVKYNNYIWFLSPMHGMIVLDLTVIPKEFRS